MSRFWQWFLGNIAPFVMASLIVAGLFVAIGFTLGIAHLMTFDWVRR